MKNFPFRIGSESRIYSRIFLCHMWKFQISIKLGLIFLFENGIKPRVTSGDDLHEVGEMDAVSVSYARQVPGSNALACHSAKKYSSSLKCFAKSYLNQ